jgi:hypothetical protein
MFRADSAHHRYWWNEHRVPSVTDVLGFAGYCDPDMIPASGLERGRLLHAATLAYDLLDPELRTELSWDPELRREFFDQEVPSVVHGLMDAYCHAMRVVEFTFLQLEEPIVSTELWLSGRPDRQGLNDHATPFVLDIKCGGALTWHGYQTAGYDLIDTRLPPRTRIRYALHLWPNTRWKLCRHRALGDYTRLQDAVHTYHTKGGPHAKPKLHESPQEQEPRTRKDHGGRDLWLDDAGRARREAPIAESSR